MNGDRFIRKTLETASHYVDSCDSLDSLDVYSTKLYGCCFPGSAVSLASPLALASPAAPCPVTTGVYKRRKLPLKNVANENSVCETIASAILDVPIEEYDDVEQVNLWNRGRQLFDSRNGVVALVFGQGTVFMRSQRTGEFSDDRFALRAIKLSALGKVAVAYCCDNPRSLLLFAEKANTGFALHDVVQFRLPVIESPAPAPPVELEQRDSPVLAFCMHDQFLLVGSVVDGLHLFSIGMLKK